jgi:hypothetical protein
MVMVVAIFGEVVCLSNGDWTTRRRVRRRPIDRAIKSPRAFRWRSLERSLSEVDFSQDDWLGSHQKTQKAPRTPIHCQLDNSEFPVVCFAVTERVEKETEMIGVSVGFFCDCEARKTLGKQSQKIHETPKIKRKRAASYVSAASSPSSALMTSLSPAMLRITCVGCAASGGAGVPAGFTHTDARSAAPTPPCGARETRKKSDKRRGGRVSGAFARDARTKRRDP